MSKLEWLEQEPTQELIKILNSLRSNMKEYMLHRDRIDSTPGGTAQQFCWSSGYLEGVKDVLEHIQDITDPEEDIIDVEAGQEYSDA